MNMELKTKTFEVLFNGDAKVMMHIRIYVRSKMN